MIGALDDNAGGLRPNPMYSGNVLRPNPMYVPNTAKPMADEGKTWTDPTLKAKTAFEADAATRHVTYMPSPATSTEGKEMTLAPDPDFEVRQTTIVFGGEGEETGQFSDPSAVVVSASNEIFVADYSNRRVQVFSMAGAYLRHFPTIVSGEDSRTVEPYDISIDGEGHLWVVGDDSLLTGFIVRYTKMGHHLATLHATFSNSSLGGIAVDTLRNLVVVTQFWDDYGEVKLLHFNGTVVRKFRTGQGPEIPGPVAVGREGNLFLSHHWGDTRVYVYNNTGYYLFSFECDRIGDGQAELEVTGVCTDSSGHVLAATWLGGTVELFTEDGRYVRRGASGMFQADGVAVAPGGQLVVTSFENSTVTVFSHY
ncbi:TRIM71 [Branchiostoma lanceolatum]|uniref:TRIM71 protein n=1 Tax=Branchiostoma lanceolatum TaxID=7740 RepID=A0A8K0A308_BRALA|nr:TRIM71 [Branchiostoma lanceolatum]